MSTGTISVETFAKMFLAGAKRLESKKEWINELNVFPVPDGDTGTNMIINNYGCCKGSCRTLSESICNGRCLVKAISFGSLRGARGNSGVIFITAFKRILPRALIIVEEIDVNSFAACFSEG